MISHAKHTFNFAKNEKSLAFEADRAVSQAKYLNNWKLVHRSHGSSENMYRIILRGKACLTGDPIVFLIAFSSANAIHIAME